MSSAIACRPAPELGNCRRVHRCPCATHASPPGGAVSGADVIHLHNPPDLLFGVAGLARVMGKAVIFDHHDLAPRAVRTSSAVACRPWSALVRADDDASGARGDRRQRVAPASGDPARPSSIGSVWWSCETRPGGTQSPPSHARGKACSDARGSATSARSAARTAWRILPEILERLCRAGLEPVLDLVGTWSGASDDQTSCQGSQRARPDPVHRTGAPRSGSPDHRTGRHLPRCGALHRAQPPVDDDQDRRVPGRGPADCHLPAPGDSLHGRRLCSVWRVR